MTDRKPRKEVRASPETAPVPIKADGSDDYVAYANWLGGYLDRYRKGRKGKS